MKIILRNLNIVLLGGVIVVGCGRKGALELPPPTMSAVSQGEFISKSEEEKPFIFDWLIR